MKDSAAAGASTDTSEGEDASGDTPELAGPESSSENLPGKFKNLKHHAWAFINKENCVE